jgi:hypothetical protein
MSSTPRTATPHDHTDMTDTHRQFETRIERLVAHLPKAIEPERDLWPGIQARLGQDAPSPSGIADLPQTIRPGRDLWPGIAARLGDRDERPSAGVGGFPRFGLAAAVGFLAIATTLVSLVVRIETSNNAIAPRSAALEASWWPEELSALYAERPADAMSAAFADASESLHRDYEMVREQRVAIEMAMTDAPGNRNLRSLWQHTYRTELELIDRAHRLNSDYERRIES